jgi:SAM-dependent methyltransferase
MAMTDVARVVRRREVRRRRVGTAYDIAIEVAHHLPRQTRLLDIGCGEGYIAHHLTALLGTNVLGVDLPKSIAAPIEYLSYDGTLVPVEDKSFDGVLLSYVLHHVQDIELLLSEVRRVVRDEGFVVIYEDVPEAWWERVPCWTHDLKWRKRTGPCTFRREPEWFDLFRSFGLEVVSTHSLSRWRNVFHPVAHWLYVLKVNGSHGRTNGH